jgi:chromosomal replication initiator protein
LARQQHLDQIWTSIQDRLRSTFPNSTYQIWLAALEPIGVENAALYVTAPESTCDWVRRRFGTTLNEAATAADPAIRRVELVEPGQKAPALEPVGRGLSRALPTQPPGSTFKPNHSFDRFVIGESNRFAHAAALTVAEIPADAYNPLFIYGPPGVGKTHLLQSIGNYITLHDPTLSVHYTTVEGFTSDFMKALQRNDVASFKQSNRRHDVLLLDDIQFLEGKPKTAEELLHTLDALIHTGAQCAITADRHPSKIASAKIPLNERLQAGLVVDLDPPDLETRVAILQKLAAHSRVSIETDVVAHIASQVTSNIRVLEGALIRVIAFASLTGKDVDVRVAEHVLASLYEDQERQRFQPPAAVSSAQIQEQTAATLGLTSADLCSTKRSRQVVYARQVAMYLCRELTPLSLPAIARQFGHRDHTTALYAHRKIKSQVLTDSATRSLVTTLTDNLSELPS